MVAAVVHRVFVNLPTTQLPIFLQIQDLSVCLRLQVLDLVHPGPASLSILPINCCITSAWLLPVQLIILMCIDGIHIPALVLRCLFTRCITTSLLPVSLSTKMVLD